MSVNGDGHGPADDTAGLLDALRAAVSSDVRKAVERYVARAVEGGAEPDTAFEAACEAAVGEGFRALATERARKAGEGNDATVAAVAGAAAFATVAVNKAAEGLGRSLVVWAGEGDG